ncbi:MAG: plasma-membrane proton-efflux P-type ATPase [Geobacteraceae bacterium]|nr:plasma-membrane proton-efflux P-type ATPase [Geobacteraceae bacterium]
MDQQTNAKGLESLPLPGLLERLGTSPEGLSGSEAQRRLAEYGPNELAEKRANPLLKFVAYFWGPIPWMIEVAAVISGVVHHWTDFTIIVVLLVMNALVGFWEEYQAGNAIASLKAKLALVAKVRRDGEWTALASRELVPGDVIRVRIGDIVPADARIISDERLEIDQSALTGESLPVTRAAGDALYSGSVVKRGESDAVVIATGRSTYFGKTARLVEEAHTESHFQQAVLKIGDYLIVIALALVILILAVALFRGDNMFTSLQFALVLTVAAIPVAMPTVLSVTMAVGSRVLAHRQAIVRKLSAIEELAGMDVLCSDKTGTLTRNLLSMGEPFTVAGYGVEELLLCAALASRAEDRDPIDLAVLDGLKSPRDLQGVQVRRFHPFDPVRKRTEAEIADSSGRLFRVAKGAPQVILELAANAVEVSGRVEEAVEEFASRGFRSLGVARCDEAGDWRFMGVIPLFDPPRADSRETIEAAARMGVKVKMVTGDQMAIAREIGGQLGLGTNILDAELFSHPEHHQAGLVAEAIEKSDGFAQVFPEHKYHIVDVLQHHGHIVGMTGDGVNDAPALKKADAGIAVSGATDAARAAAAIVLLTPGLSVIIDAIKESRTIFQRMNSYAIYRISETIRVLLFMTLSILVFNFYPVTAVMIVLLALLNDGAVLTIAYDNARFSDQPSAWDMRTVLGVASLVGLAGVVASFGLFYLAERVFVLDRNVIQSLIYLKLSVAGQLTIYVTRTRGPFWSIPPSPILLSATLAAQFIATLVAVYGIFVAPIGWPWAGFVWGYALAWFFINDRVKLAAYKVFDITRPGLLGWKTVK